MADVVSATKPISPTRRLWPQVEMLKAFLALDQCCGSPGYLAEADHLASAIMKSYMTGAPAGCWHDCLDTDDLPISRTIPASSLYHLWTAVADLIGQRRIL